jgi:opacity protein-like surface antigen
MKKIFLIAVLTIIGVSNVQAQEVTFGAKAGLNFSNLRAKVNGNTASSKGRTGFYVGALADIKVSEMFHVQPEVLFSMAGSKAAKVNSIEIPVMAKVYVAQGLSLQAGPQLGFIVGGDIAKNARKSVNFGLNFGAGYELPEVGVFFDARYNLGLSNISKLTNSTLKTKGFQVGIGYRF